MNSVSCQIDRLLQVLSRLDLQHTLPHDEAHQLLLSLANTTAIVRRAVEWQKRGQANECLRPLGADDAEDKENQSTPLDHRKGEQQLRGGADLVTRAPASPATEHVMGDPIADWKRETISSIAKCSDVPVEELRSYNPKLSVYADDEILPANTYIRIKKSPSTQRAVEDEEVAAMYQRGEEVFLGIDDVGVTECPLPLAPLPSTQGESSRSVGVAGLSEPRDESNPRSVVGARGGSNTRGSMMMLPSPSPVRYSAPFREQSIGTDCDEWEGRQVEPPESRGLMPVATGVGAATDAFRRSGSYSHAGYSPASPMLAARGSLGEAGEIHGQGKTCWLENAIAVTGLSSVVVPPSLLSQVKASMPPLANFPPAPTVDETGIINDVQSNDRSSSSDAPNLIDDTVPQCEPKVDTSASGGALEPAQQCESVSNNKLGQPRGPTGAATVEEAGERDGPDAERTPSFAAEKTPSFTAEKSDYITSSRDHSVSGCELETLHSIAAERNIAVGRIIEWNPHLSRYGVDDPLPPNLPIVLPMPVEQVL
ncbi:hypothetical protein, conserved [Trypanosoma brucei brucei TREU927]|uniref:LysM domain-containing protein n=1 Tax=Trypanosoma brucei brucei (strain 927/4 GUTat10.1) TaxID=185431 RepID=Q57UC0_TRYB2|nr:hypothetical protein, conserved [Trypanosoma brucei brucei TREU927]AAX70799.1 hypothetical protein, conserved [Trypanosoma brucei]AAZ11457.1 hypothetical protein, conserved [Trypanosoma brucei brucei TREU927]